MLGDYAAVVPCELFLKNNQPRASNQTDPGIMKLEGLRIAMSSEVEEGAKFSAQQVKRITGGDRLEGRNPYDKELRNFEPTHLVLMIGNHEPVPPTGDPAFWDRTWLIQHPVRFVKGEPDPTKFAGNQFLDPAAHLGGGLVGESQRQNPEMLPGGLFQNPGDTAGQHPCFA